jgi:hypothetical protein
MTKNFRDITNDLFSKIGAEELALQIGCSLGSVKQARMDRTSSSYREPPAGWEEAARKLALDRAAYFTKLAERLSRPR